MNDRFFTRFFVNCPDVNVLYDHANEIHDNLKPAIVHLFWLKDVHFGQDRACVVYGNEEDAFIFPIAPE
jgi:hypothetical protein